MILTGWRSQKEPQWGGSGGLLRTGRHRPAHPRIRTEALRGLVSRETGDRSEVRCAGRARCAVGGYFRAPGSAGVSEVLAGDSRTRPRVAVARVA